MVTSVVRRLRLAGAAGALSMAAVALAAGCADIDSLSRWFPDAREYLGECTPPSHGESSCWWFAFTPAGVVDFASGGDILYRGDYRINGIRVRVTTPQHPDLDLRLSPAQDTLWLPHGGHAVRIE
ncbi:hypothetical protein BH23GEM2_BH23GEM2_20190 [soil metagenome]